MDKLLKIAVIVGVLLAGFGIFYHYVLYLPDLEQKKLERERVEKDEAARRAEQEKWEAARRAEAEQSEARHRELQRQSAYYDCLARAGKNYDANWAAACKTNAKSRSARLKNCLEDPSIMGNQYMGERYCRSTYGGADASPECTLPSSVADNINKTHEKEKQQCLAEAKLF